MRVFVLGTGRCGTTTFSHACSHIENMTSGHETNSRLVGDDRLAYPDGHIEADNRLSWMLGALGSRYDGTDVLYVHLRRDPDDVVRSFARRWNSDYRASIIRAFAHGIVQRTADWPEEDVARVCRFYVDVVTANITEFLSTRRSVEYWLPHLATEFPGFMDAIGATGPMDRILAELETQHNASLAE